jgi:hypothetical protein
MANGSNRVVLGPRPQGLVEGWGDEKEIANVDKQEEGVGEAREITMAKTETETATGPATDTKTEIETGALDTNNSSDPTQLSKIIQVDDCGAGDRSRTQGGRNVLARATERNRRDWDQPFSIQNKNEKKTFDSDTDGEWPGG